MILQGIPFDNFINGEKPVTEKRIFQIKRRICYQQRCPYCGHPFHLQKAMKQQSTETMGCHSKAINLHLPFSQTQFSNLRWVLHFVTTLSVLSERLYRGDTQKTRIL